MLDHDTILRLIPQQGRMCLLDRVERWDERTISCSAVSHLAADNPLRRDGALSVVAGIEYGLQAAALHGALIGQDASAGAHPPWSIPGNPAASGAAQTPAFLGGLRDTRFHLPRLDLPAFGRLLVEAEALQRELHGSIYAFVVRAEDGRRLLEGRAAFIRPSERSHDRVFPATP